MTLEVVALIVGFVGLVPLANEAAGWILARLPTRRLLSLRRDTRLDVVVTTNEIQRQEPGVADAYLTAVGEVRGVAAVARILSRVYPRKPLTVHISDEYPGNPEGDVLLLGGPRRNRWARHFVEKFNREYPVTLILDAESYRLELNGMRIGHFDQRLNAGVPTEDVGVVILAPWSSDRRSRVILCAGLSTYGTEAAARFIFADVHRDRSLRRRLSQAASAGDALVIGVHALIEARSVQQTSVLLVDGQEMLWTGTRR